MRYELNLFLQCAMCICFFLICKEKNWLPMAQILSMERRRITRIGTSSCAKWDDFRGTAVVPSVFLEPIKHCPLARLATYK